MDTFGQQNITAKAIKLKGEGRREAESNGFEALNNKLAAPHRGSTTSYI